MTDTPPDLPRADPPTVSPPEPRPVLPLEYGHESRPRSSRAAFAGRIAGGFVGYIVLSYGWFWLASVLRLGLGGLFGWLGMTGALLMLALYLRTHHGRPGYGYGILLVFLIPLGLVLLLMGLCWFGR
jgi:hypothetical protein